MRVFAGLFEEICQIHFKSAVGISRKTDGFDENFIVTFCIKVGTVNTAKVNEIKCSSAENKESLAAVKVLGGGER